MNDNDDAGLPADRASEVRAAAFEVLRSWRDGGLDLADPPSEVEMIELLSTSLGEQVSTVKVHGVVSTSRPRRPPSARRACALAAWSSG